MHVLRIFGNESAHERNKDRMPSELTENDFIIPLLSQPSPAILVQKDPKTGTLFKKQGNAP